MSWSDFYLFCFGFGFFFSLVTVLTGHLHLDFGGHDAGGIADLGDTSHALEFGDGGHDGQHHSAKAGSVSPFNLGTIAAFLAWFGGTGYLTTRFYQMWFLTTLGVAMSAGLAGGWLVYLFLTKVLMRSREELDPADYDMIGVLGQVSGTIRASGIGEILYSQGGSRRAAPARSETGAAIAKGTEVVVTRFERGIAYVRPWDELANGVDAQSTGA